MSIQDMKTNDDLLIEYLKAENEELKERVKICKDNHERYDIKAIDENTELRKENKELKAELDKYGDSDVYKPCNINHDVRDEYENGLLAENKKLKAELETANDGIDDLNDVLKDMQKESIEQIKENKELKDSIFKADKDYAELSDKLQAVNDSLMDDLEEEQANVKELKAEVKRGEKQYHMLASLKEYKAEADEYFHHNPQSKGIRFHMIDFDDYDYDDNDGLNGLSGEYNGMLLAEDCLVEIDNNERSN